MTARAAPSAARPNPSAALQAAPSNPGAALQAACSNPDAAPSAARITLSFAPSDEDFAAIFAALEHETAPITGPCRIDPVALLLTDGCGAVTGGLWGRIVYNWLVIEMLVVPASLRGTGIGTTLMQRAEHTARARACTGIQLTRLDFQAPAFYEHLGFITFGVQADVPPGHSCFHLLKRLDALAPPRAVAAPPMPEPF
jgi:GNAT superfamily N-acetyltransferase